MEFAVSHLLKQNSYLIDIPITDLCNLNCTGCLSFSSLSKSPIGIFYQILQCKSNHAFLKFLGCITNLLF